MADIIKLLPDHVANQIAAGEVVQRPASVVKELMENAIDAGATCIKLIVKDGGKTLIQVVDDGSGMSETDARLSFERHATSKISSAQDLFNLATKGFRGEALASIAAIAHVDMQTRTAANEVGTHLKIEGSKIVSQVVIATPEGTSISVKNLFFNIPARRNFLKSTQVELRHITDEFHRVALVHPNIEFHFYNNGSEIFNLPIGKHRQRIVHIFGSKMDNRLVPVSEETEVVKVSGFICKPEFAKKSRGEQFFFANNRYIKSPYLHHAVVAAFEGLIKSDTHPGYFLFLEVDPSSIDINIHPTKTEVKFDDENTLYAILRSTIKHSLGQFNVAPVLDFDHDPNLDTPYSYKEKGAVIPKVTVDASFNPFQEEPVKKGGSGGSFRKQSTKGWEDLYEGLGHQNDHNEFSSVVIESESEEQGTLYSGEGVEEHLASTFQLRRKYVVSTVKSGMLVIHQNRAHERILFEKFLGEITVKEGVSQQLLFPLELSFNKQELAVVKEIHESLTNIGFVFDSLEHETVKVTGVPMMVPESGIGTVLDRLIADYMEGYSDGSISQAEMLAKALSRNLAVRTGDVLDSESQLMLVNNLFACKEPNLSPFQKITYTIISEGDIDKKFNQMGRMTEAVKHILIINVILFFATQLYGDQMYQWLALWFPKNENFQIWQIITHMFMHGGFMHIAFNMFALWMFGTPVERVLGKNRFLFVYFSAGLGAVLFQLGFYYFNFLPAQSELLSTGLSNQQILDMLASNRLQEGLSEIQISTLRAVMPEYAQIYNASMVGASGCIMGILAAFGMMNPEARLMLIFLPIPIKAKYFIPGIILLDVISAITGQSFFSPSNTAYMAHVGGALTGFIIMWYWKRNQFNKNRWN